MRILKLTPQTEKLLLARREQQDAEAQATATEIVADVRKRGDAALFAYTKKFDHTDLGKTGVWITPQEIRAAHIATSTKFRKAIEKAAENVRRIAEKQLPRPWTVETTRGVKIRQVVRPIASIGCYIPGGRFSLVSTLIMTIVPAKVAGVPKIIAVCPKPNPELLAAARILGVERIARIGGAQVIAALAYGTKSVPRVDKIFGPGNKYVTAAKQLVSNDCAIDLPAGPTEAIVFAEHGNARWIAADLLAQAEHDEAASSICITTSSELAREVVREIARQLETLERREIAAASIERYGAVFVVESIEAACELANLIAPEHLELMTEDDERAASLIENAGAIFFGAYSSEPVGDYIAGPNHVLPTLGSARFSSALGVSDFLKRQSIIRYNREALEANADAIATMADAEGLTAHKRAVLIRTGTRDGKE